MQQVDPKIEPSWKEVLYDEFNTDYFLKLKQFLIGEKKKYTIYPPGSRIFAALDHTPFNNVKAVILGQDPYHGKGQANGLCFSVSDGIRQPPSLQNIFKELNSDLDIPIPKNGNLEQWADQGVLLLNATLTVRAGQAGSHQRQGWEQFTNRIIREVSDKKEGVVFILWGRYAQAKEELIDTNKHFVLKAPHPSPFSASYGFFGCKHFSKTNEILRRQGKEEIDWRLE
ncbi:MAG: uracil-DNA glycosylase [Bacteroidales bacterium]|nr:uracil-DNA glycosylase [Bacteroidales bacterium]